MAERAFMEASEQLTAREATGQTPMEEEKTEKEKDEKLEEETTMSESQEGEIQMGSEQMIVSSLQSLLGFQTGSDSCLSVVLTITLSVH